MDCLPFGRDFLCEEQPGNSPSIAKPSQILMEVWSSADEFTVKVQILCAFRLTSEARVYHVKYEFKTKAC
jgi:hypothetical protein